MTEGSESAVLGAEALEGLMVAEGREGTTLRHPTWEALDPDLACGITTAEAGDFGVFGAPADRLYDSFAELVGGLGFSHASVPLLVHGHEIAEVAYSPADDRPVSLELSGRMDGQLTRARGLLLVATAADCVPVYLWETETDVLGLVHAGWRGAAAGILTKALQKISARSGAASVRLHLGPAICGNCYEVDEPVLTAFGFRGTRARIDLRGLLAQEALEAGVPPRSISVSKHCTRCGSESLHSHRGSGGLAGRMAAFLGRRRAPEGG